MVRELSNLVHATPEDIANRIWVADADFIIPDANKLACKGRISMLHFSACLQMVQRPCFLCALTVAGPTVPLTVIHSCQRMENLARKGPGMSLIGERKQRRRRSKVGSSSVAAVISCQVMSRCCGQPIGSVTCMALYTIKAVSSAEARS